MVEEKDQEEGTRRDQKTRSDMIFLFTKHNSIHSIHNSIQQVSSLETAHCCPGRLPIVHFTVFRQTFIWLFLFFDTHDVS